MNKNESNEREKFKDVVVKCIKRYECVGKYIGVDTPKIVFM